VKGKRDLQLCHLALAFTTLFDADVFSLCFCSYRRATLRKVMTQVTPPPSPKNNGEDVIKSETWSSRLRNNQTRSCNGVVRDFRRKGRSRLPLTSTPKVPSAVVVKKEPRDVFHNDDSNCSHSSDVSVINLINFIIKLESTN
jgi:hypothetical protein